MNTVVTQHQYYQPSQSWSEFCVTHERRPESFRQNLFKSTETI